MFAVPLVSVVGLWVFATVSTASSAIINHNYNSSTRSISGTGVLLSLGLTEERAQTYLWLIGDRKTADNSMISARNLVNKALSGARTSLTPQGIPLTAAAESALSVWFTELGQIPGIRHAVDSGAMSPAAAFQAYTTIIDGQFHYFYSAIENSGAALAQSAIGSVDAGYAAEMASRETVLVDGALADRGVLTVAAQQSFAAAAANRQLLMNAVVTLLPPSMNAVYVSMESSAQYQQFQAMENRIIASLGSGGPLPVIASAWQSASQAYLGAMLPAELNSGNQLAATAASQSDRSLTEALLAGGVGLVAVVASVLLLAWFGRKITRDLRSLHGSVRVMAEERLPRVVERLRVGDDVDVQAESPPPPESGIREISQIGASFGTVQEAAVAAAVDQARLRKGVSKVFLNISMRNQSLLHRQLGMLDSMERRTSEPASLADLFRLDHLTTRLRRHAESLIILSGSTPARGWRNPVPVVDVLRAAIAEVEDYVRVDVVSESRDLVAGNAVNDTIHLCAELIENATVFSPPSTRIEVTADRVGAGLAVEIEDRGLGMANDDLAGINSRLASLTEFDLENSDQLGLFVVSRLAARHAITVTLRRSAYGGTRAIVLLPFSVIVRAEDAHSAGPVSESPAAPDAGDAADAEVARSTDRAELLTAVPDLTPQTWNPGRPAPLAPAHSPSAAAPSSLRPEAMKPWSGAFQRMSARQNASAQNGPQDPGPEPVMPPDPPQPEAEATAIASSASHLGMPIRVPQANLAPQLRVRRETSSQTAAPEAVEVSARSPEATRDMFVSMQHGWQRGRLDDLDDPGGAPDNGTA